MGLVHQKLIVKPSHDSRRRAEVQFLIDSGAVYSLVPAPTLKTLGIRPHRKIDFTLADGTTITRRVGDAYFEFRGEGGAAPVIFGEEGDEPLLGATTLESLGLVLDPFKRRLVPMRMMLAPVMQAVNISPQRMSKNLDHAPVVGAVRRGKRPPKVEPRKRESFASVDIGSPSNDWL